MSTIRVRDVKSIEEMESDGFRVMGSLLLGRHDLDETEFIAHYVYKLYVPPAYRGQGVATRLLQRVMELTPRGFCLAAEPWADEPMTTEQLLAWYLRLGFVQSNDGSSALLWLPEEMR